MGVSEHGRLTPRAGRRRATQRGALRAVHGDLVDEHAAVEALEHALIRPQDRADVGDCGFQLLERHVPDHQQLLEAPLAPFSGDVEQHGGAEDGVGNHEVLPLERAHGRAEQPDVDDDTVHLAPLRSGVELHVLSRSERLRGVQHDAHEHVAEDLAPGETDGETGDTSDGKQGVEVEADGVGGEERRHDTGDDGGEARDALDAGLVARAAVALSLAWWTGRRVRSQEESTSREGGGRRRRRG